MAFVLVFIVMLNGELTYKPMASFPDMEACQTVAAQAATEYFVRCVQVDGQPDGNPT